MPKVTYRICVDIIYLYGSAEVCSLPLFGGALNDVVDWQSHMRVGMG